MCWAPAKYFHMGVEFTGSRWHVGVYITSKGSGKDLLPPLGLKHVVQQEELVNNIYEVSFFNKTIPVSFRD